MTRPLLFAAALLLSACSPDPFLEVEAAWTGTWKVLSQQEDDSCDPLTSIDPDYARLELELPSVDGVYLEATGCTSEGCDELPWLLMPLDEATHELLTGQSSIHSFFVDQEVGGRCEVQSGSLEATIVDEVMTLDLRTFAGGFDAGGYEECESIAEQVVGELCTNAVRYKAVR